MHKNELLQFQLVWGSHPLEKSQIHVDDQHSHPIVFQIINISMNATWENSHHLQHDLWFIMIYINKTLQQGTVSPGQWLTLRMIRGSMNGGATWKLAWCCRACVLERTSPLQLHLPSNVAQAQTLTSSRNRLITATWTLPTSSPTASHKDWVKNLT